MSLSFTQCAFRANKVVDMEVEAEFVYADILRTLQSSILGHDTTVRPEAGQGRGQEEEVWGGGKRSPGLLVCVWRCES